MTNFNLEEFKTTLLETCNYTNELILTHKTKFHESLRSNPFIHIDDYIHNTTKYGQFNGTRNKLLFGGEVDYLTLSIYDVLLYMTMWRLFNVLDEIELINARAESGLSLELGNTYGNVFQISLRRKDGSYDRKFDPLASIKPIKLILDELKKYEKFDLGKDLYNRFELFGLVDFIDSIDDIDLYSSELSANQITKLQPTIIDISDYASSDCHNLDSIYQYSKYMEPTSNKLKAFYITQVLTLTLDQLKNIAIKKFQDVISFAYQIGFPILYNIKK